MKRRILPMIMAVIIILSTIQVPAWAADESSPMETADNTGLTSEQPMEKNEDPGAPVEEEEPASSETNSLPNGETEEEPAPEEQADNVAEVNGQGFPTLQAAIDAANGAEITLLADVKDCARITLSQGETVNINLNDCDIGFVQNGYFYIQHGTLNLTGNGEVYEQSPYYGAVLMKGGAEDVSNYSVVTVGENVTLRGWAGLFIDQNGNNNYGIVANVYGTLKSVKDTSGAGGHALYVNGTIKATEGNVPKITLDGATLNTEAGNGIYLAGYTETSIRNSTITSSSEGSTGIEIRAGKLTITDSTVTGGTGKFEAIPNGNGSTTANVALAVVQHTTELPLEVTINSGEFTGGAALFQQNVQKNEDEAVATIKLDVRDGNFVGQVYSENVENFIFGGTFSDTENITSENYLTDSVKLENNEVTPLGPTDEASVAQVGSTYYRSLSAAIAAAKDGGTVTLLKDTELTSVRISKGITLDLGGKTLKLVAGSTSPVGLSFSSGSSKITNGTIQDERVVVSGGNNTAGYYMVVVNGDGTSLETSNVTMITNRPAISTNQYTYIIQLQNGSSATLNSGTVLKDQMYNGQTYETYGAVGVTVLGTNGGTTTSLTVNEGAEISTYGFAVSGNGTMHGTSITINGGEITSEISTAIYHPQEGEITINGDSIITGENAGIEIRSGELTVNGGTIRATAKEFECDPNGSGTTTVGAALAIAQHTTKRNITVTINGGTFSGVKALNESNPQENDPAPQVKLSVRDGDFQGEVTTADVDNFVSGGTFSSAVEDEYCAPGFEPTTTADGKHTVAVANDMTVKIVDANGNDVAAYETLDAALTHVTPGQTIALLANVEYNGKVSIPEGVTLDGNGNAITATAEITSGAFIEVMTDNVTIKDLVVNTNGKAKHGIQFYQTKGGELSGVTVNGGSYTSVIVNGSTDIRIENCTLNPGSGAYANIEYAMGSGVTTVPSVTVSNPKYDSGQPLVYVDSATIKAITNEANPSDKDIADALEQVNKNVTISGMEMVWVNGSFVARPIPTPVDPGDDDDDDNNNSGSSSVRRYDIEADAGRGGDISPDGRVRVRRGENQTFRITADDGYEIYDVEVDGESVGAVSRYTFENVREDHTISATFRQTGAQTEEAQLPFLDVAEGAWYYDAVAYCYENGIMDGTSSVSFAPGMLLNRAMAAQVLYNLADGTASTAAGFPDVAASAWYADAVNWAAANGYVTGYDNGSFGPEDSLTREQLAVILYRYAGSPEPTGSLDGFTDAASTSDYAVDALRWAVGEGLLTGKDGGRLDPAGTASRAELAQILARFAQM